MPRIEHRNSPSPIPFHKLLRPRSKHGAKGSIGMAMRAAKASLKKPNSDDDAIVVLDMMAADDDKTERLDRHERDSREMEAPQRPLKDDWVDGGSAARNGSGESKPKNHHP